jgi:hypothetical protein
MDITTIVIIILSLLTLGAIAFLAPYIRKIAKDNNIPIDDILNSITQITTIAQQLLGNLNLDDKTKGLFNTIVQSAQLAVKYAEQLYISGQCAPDERKGKAIEFVKMALADMKIEVTPDMEKFITAVIEAAVFLLPKTSDTLKLKAGKKATKVVTDVVATEIK